MYSPHQLGSHQTVSPNLASPSILYQPATGITPNDPASSCHAAVCHCAMSYWLSLSAGRYREKRSIKSTGSRSSCSTISTATGLNGCSYLQTQHIQQSHYCSLVLHMLKKACLVVGLALKPLDQVHTYLRQPHILLVSISRPIS